MTKSVRIFIVIVLIAWPFVVMAQADLIFQDGFESGDFSAWSDTYSPSGGIGITTNSAIHGNYGIEAIITNGDGILFYDIPDGSMRLRARFYINTSGISLADGCSARISNLQEYDSGESLIIIGLENSEGTYGIRPFVYNNGDYDDIGVVTIISGLHFIEFDVLASSNDGATDGYFTMWLDGIQVKAVTGIDSDGYDIDTIWLGLYDYFSCSGSTGTLYLDTYDARSETYIGAYIDENEPTETPTPTQEQTQVSTETPTPTITPTPSNLSEVQLSSGSTLIVGRSISYGDIAITLAIMVYVVIYTVTNTIQVIDKWTS